MKIKTHAILHTPSGNLVTFQNHRDYGDNWTTYCADGNFNDNFVLTGHNRALEGKIEEAQFWYDRASQVDDMANCLGDPKNLKVVEITIDLIS